MQDESGREYFDFEFDECFEPCTRVPWPSKDTCGSQIRIARFFPEGPRVGFVCDQGHKIDWEGRGMWIPMDVFGQDGPYAGMIPEGIFPTRKRSGLSTTIKISNAADYRARTATSCCVCDCPPFNDQPLRRQLQLIAEHKPFLYDDILPHIEYMIRAQVYSDDWFTRLPEDLQGEVRLSAAESKIQADHGIPRKLLQELWATLSTDERSAATNALAFPLCAFCNKGKRDQLDTTVTILKRFAKVRYGGNEAEASKDDVYPHIISLCMKAQGLRGRSSG